MALLAVFRLARAGFVLAREGALSLVETKHLSGPVRFAVRAGRLIERGAVRRTGRIDRLSRALNRLGPTYVKFGQSLATRPDIVGAQLAEDLSALQDRMPPFDGELVPGILRDALGEKARALSEISEPIAAASIAQVHKGVLTDAQGGRRVVAIKVLRPGVEARFARDLRTYLKAARIGERTFSALRRLRPVEVVKTLQHSARMELDLRFEAAAISRFSENAQENAQENKSYKAPKVEWDYVAQNVLITEWVDAIPIRDVEALDAAGLDRKLLARKLMQGFLQQAVGDGFFHADMHPGNLFADPATGDIIAVDFGIVGTLGRREQRFLAEMLYGFIQRDYDLIARRHFEIGYVPADQSERDFALAIRAIGEPLAGRPAKDISIGDVLGQLFLVTEMFNMATRPELILLQKTMVMAEGVSRALDPDLNMWDVSEPVLRPFVTYHSGPGGQLERLGEQARVAINTMALLPDVVARADRVLARIEDEQKHPSELWPNWAAPFALALLLIAFVGLIWWLVG